MVCELMHRCEFFKALSVKHDAVKSGFILRYCMVLADSEKCARKIFRREQGQAPPVTMTPAGDHMQFDEETP